MGLYDIQTGRRIGTARPVEALNPLAKHFGDSLDMQKVAAANKRQQGLRRATLAMAKEINGSSGALAALPWMRPATERRTAISVAPKGKALEANNGAPALSSAEYAELEELAASLQQPDEAAQAYEKPAFFASELERYGFLFDLAVVESRRLDGEDAAFMMTA